ncbi:acyl-CoA synthetase [Mycobacterium tuberculosis]|nr:acyl-CoA synthetase [Mycobacterium tuberculosis]
MSAATGGCGGLVPNAVGGDLAGQRLRQTDNPVLGNAVCAESGIGHQPGKGRGEHHMPARALLKQFIAHNRMMTGGFAISGQMVTLTDITCPILAFVGEVDDIGQPASVRGIRRAAPNSEVYECLIRAGHFGLVVGSRAAQQSWPTVADWVRWISGDGTKPENIHLMADHVFNRLDIPSWMARMGFQMMDPLKTAKARVDFVRQLHDREALHRQFNQEAVLTFDYLPQNAPEADAILITVPDIGIARFRDAFASDLAAHHRLRGGSVTTADHTLILVAGNGDLDVARRLVEEAGGDWNATTIAHGRREFVN